MRRLATIAAILVMAVPVAAQQTKPRDAKAGPPPTVQELSTATDTLSVFVSALNSKEIPAATKEGLLMCLYDNPLGKIAQGAAHVFAVNKTADPKSASQRLFIIASLCHAPLPGIKATR